MKSAIRIPSALQRLDSWFQHVFFKAVDRKESSENEHHLIQSNTVYSGKEEEINFLLMKNRFFTELGEKGEHESPNLHICQVRHCQQLGGWDCGLACLIMIVRWIKDEMEKFDPTIDKNDMNISQPISVEEVLYRNRLMRKVNTESIWTIDLFMLLHEILNGENEDIRLERGALKSSLMFVSRNLGIDKNYRGLQYYKENFRKDEQRVRNLFEKATNQNSCVAKVSNLGLDYVVDMVSRRNILAMALIDNSALSKHAGNFDFDSDHASDSFSGHFILLCGISEDRYDLERAVKRKDGENIQICFVVKNPGSSNPTDFISFNVFLDCWQRVGTDQDIIFIGCS